VEPIALEGGLSYFLGARTFLDAANPPKPTHLKRLLREIRGLAVPSPPPARPAAAAADRPAIAVLPFRSPGRARDQAYLSEGIADDLVDRLSRSRALPVLPATRPRGSDIHAICAHLRQKLGVEYVLDGSVQRKSGRLHVHARLIEAATGSELWGQTYDADCDDILRVQEEISDAIAGQMGVEVLDRERERSIRLDGSELGRWERLLRADWHARRLDRLSNRTARSLYEQLTEADPRLAAAHGGTAMTHVYDVIMGWSESTEASLALAVAAGERAVEENDRLPSAHLALGAASLLAGDPKRSLHESDRACQLHPAYSLAHWLRGTALALLSRPAEALDSIQRAMRLSPQDPWTFAFMSGAAIACFAANYLEDAMSYADRSIHLMRDYPPSRWTKCAVLGLLGRKAEAAEAAREAEAVDPGHTFPATVDRMLRRENRALAARYLSGWRKAGVRIPDGRSAPCKARD
jgi:adenylate cyclase